LLFQTSLGIDIQEDSFSIICLKPSLKGIRLAAHSIYPFEKDQSEEEKTDHIGRLVKEFLKNGRISPTGIFLGIPRDVAILRYVEFPLAVKENLLNTLGYEMDKYVPFSVDEIYFDFQIISEDKVAGKLRLLCIVVKKDLIEHYLGLADRFDAKISGIEISSTAMANYFASQEGRNARNGRAFIYLTEDHLEINLLADRILTYSRSLTRGEWGNNLSERLFEELQKLREGSGEDHGWLETVLCASKADLEMLDHFRNEEDFDPHPVDLSKAGIPSFALIPAYGLALKGIQKVPMEINLLPLKLRRKPSKIGYYTMMVLAGLLLLSAFSWGGGNILRHELRLDYLDTEIKRLSSEIKRVDQLRTEGKKIEDRIYYLNTLSQGGVPVLEILKELSQRIPKDAWVRRFSFSEKGIEIEGQADAASELIPLLEASPLFRDVMFLSAITKRDGRERFKIGLNKKLLK